MQKRIQYTKGLLATRCFALVYRPKRDSPVTIVTSSVPQVPQDPFPRPQTQDPNGMVKMLPIPSLKKVKITKTKIPTKKSPQDSQPQKKSPHNQEDMMLRSRKDHGPVPIATFAVTFAVLPLPRRSIKGDRRSLGFVLVLPVPTGQEEEGALQSQKVPGKELQPRNDKTGLFSDY